MFKSVSEITIFGLQMMVKSGLEIHFLKSLHAEIIFQYFLNGKTFAQKYKFSNKYDLGISKQNYRPLFTNMFSPKMVK